MKFVFITREGIQNPGARIRGYNFFNRLKDKGLETEVFSFVDRVGAKAGKNEADFIFLDKIKCIYKGYKLLSQAGKNTVFIVNRFNYHAVSAWLVSKIKKVPFIFDMDDWEAREEQGSKAEYLCRLFAKESRLCVAASGYLRDYLSRFNRKVYYIPTGVDTNKFKPSPCKEKEDFIFSWHGSINRPEIVSYLKFAVECFLALRGKYPFIKFFIAGGGIFGKETAALVNGYRCNNLVYKGRLNFEDMPFYLDGIDAGFIPLLDRSRFNLSKSPVKLFEYMAKAKPVIASSVGEAVEIITDGENGFLADTKESFIKKMELLIKDRVLRKNIGCSAWESVEKEYSLDVLSERMYNILAHLNG